MVSSKLKKQFEESVSTTIKRIGATGITPNIVTTLGLLVSFAAALSYVFWNNWSYMLPLASILILISGFFDAIDGMLARVNGKVTIFGGFFDSVADRYSDAAIIIGIILGGLCDPIWGLLTLFGSMMVSYARARSEAAGVQMASVGLAERAERMLLLSFVTFAAFFWLDALKYGIILLAVLTHLTVIQRVLYFRKKSQ